MAYKPDNNNSLSTYLIADYAEKLVVILYTGLITCFCLMIY